MRCVFVFVLLGFVLFPASALGEPASDAATTADEWIGRIDRGDFGASWETAGELIRSRISKKQWVDLMTEERQRLGRLEERVLVTRNRAVDPPGAPLGEYTFISYSVKYAGGAHTEQLVLRRASGGQWGVVGYWRR